MAEHFPKLEGLEKRKINSTADLQGFIEESMRLHAIVKLEELKSLLGKKSIKADLRSDDFVSPFLEIFSFGRMRIRVYVSELTGELCINTGYKCKKIIIIKTSQKMFK